MEIAVEAGMSSSFEVGCDTGFRMKKKIEDGESRDSYYAETRAALIDGRVESVDFLVMIVTRFNQALQMANPPSADRKVTSILAFALDTIASSFAALACSLGRSMIFYASTGLHSFPSCGLPFLGIAAVWANPLFPRWMPPALDYI